MKQPSSTGVTVILMTKKKKIHGSNRSWREKEYKHYHKHFSTNQTRNEGKEKLLQAHNQTLDLIFTHQGYQGKK